MAMGRDPSWWGLCLKMFKLLCMCVYITFKIFYWSIVALQCCVSTVQQSVSVICIHVSSLYFLPASVITEHWGQLPALLCLGFLLTDLRALPWYPKFLPVRAAAAAMMQTATGLMFTVNYVSGVVRTTTIQVWVPATLTWVLQEIWASPDRRASSLAQQVSLRQHSQPHSTSPHNTKLPKPVPHFTEVHW